MCVILLLYNYLSMPAEPLWLSPLRSSSSSHPTGSPLLQPVDPSLLIRQCSPEPSTLRQCFLQGSPRICKWAPPLFPWQTRATR